MSNAPQSPVPRGRRIPLSRFWLDWRISIFLVAVCVLVVGVATVAIWGRPGTVPLGAGSSPAIHRERAQFYEGLGRIDEAIREYQAALRLSPQDPGVHKGLALLFEKKGGFTESIAAYERYLELEPDAADRSTIRARIEHLRQGH